MTRDRANEVLFLWKVGAELFPPHVITQALYLTGDLSGPDLEADTRLVRVPSVPSWVESTSLALSQPTCERASSHLLEIAGDSSGRGAAQHSGGGK